MQTANIKNLILKPKTAIITSFIINCLLSVIKTICGFVFNSHAMIMDGIHSFSDMGCDAFVYFINKLSSHAPDRNHPYGHQRFETLGTLFLGSLLFTFAGALFYKSFLMIISNKPTNIPSWHILLVSSLSMIINEFLFRYNKIVGEKNKSKILLASAWHNRTDSISSFIVLISAFLAMNGIPKMDIIASMIVVILIGKVGWDLVKPTILELTETSIDDKKLKEYKSTIMSTDGVLGVHNLRGKRMGNKIILDLNVEVSDKITVSEGHEISSWVAKNLIESYSEVSDVIVHIDVENDMISDFISNRMQLLPLRSKILRKLTEVWSSTKVFNLIEDIKLHYHNKNITIELYVSQNNINSLPNPKELDQLAKNIDWYKESKFIARINK